MRRTSHPNQVFNPAYAAQNGRPLARQTGMGAAVVVNTPNNQCSTAIQTQLEQGYFPYPWVEMPPDGLPFDVEGRIATPLAGTGETVVLSFQVPDGHHGAVMSLHNNYTGPGFNEGSGNIVWRIRRGQGGLNGTFVNNFGNILVSRGTVVENRRLEGPVLVNSLEFLTYTVTIPAGSPVSTLGTAIACGLAGIFWPKGSAINDFS